MFYFEIVVGWWSSGNWNQNWFIFLDVARMSLKHSDVPTHCTPSVQFFFSLASKVCLGWVNAALALEWKLWGLWVIANKSINLECWLLDGFFSPPKPTFIWKQQQIHPEDSTSIQASHPAAACLHASEMHFCGSAGITLYCKTLCFAISDHKNCAYYYFP